MRLIVVPYVLAAIGLGAVGYGLMRSAAEPPNVITTGTVKITDKAGAQMVFPQRVVSIGGFEVTEVQLPGGTWIDCRGDCSAAITQEHTNFWDQVRMREK